MNNNKGLKKNQTEMINMRIIITVKTSMDLEHNSLSLAEAEGRPEGISPNTPQKVRGVEI